MRAVLDRIYKIALWCAAGCILAICAIVSVQVSLNILARIGGPEWSYTLPSYADFAGYFLAAASFFALGPTSRAGVHIRVNLVVSRLGAGPAWLAELASLVIATAVAVYATYYSAHLLYESWDYGDTSTGIIAIPLWIPQTAMVGGLALLSVAFADTLLDSLRAKSAILTDTGAE